MEGVKILEMRRRGTPRRKGRGTFGRWWRELERPSPAQRAAQGCWSAVTYNRRRVGKWKPAGRASEVAVVPIELTGQHNRR